MFAAWTLSARVLLRAAIAVTVTFGTLARAGTGLARPARAACLGSEGRIAFVRNGNIYSILASGSGLHLLAGGGRNSGPRWSPNGSRLAYLDNGRRLGAGARPR
jgi:hypothetical protein